MLYEKLPLVDLTAPRVPSHRNRTGNSVSDENTLQDSEDAMAILNRAGLGGSPYLENIVEAKEKYMVETQPKDPAKASPDTLTMGMRRKDGIRRPHYTRLFVFDTSLVFQAACCLPLKIIAASLDGNPVSGRVLFNSHSEKEGGKLVYEFLGKGTEIVIDLKRGGSTRAQRLIFTEICR